MPDAVRHNRRDMEQSKVINNMSDDLKDRLSQGSIVHETLRQLVDWSDLEVVENIRVI